MVKISKITNINEKKIITEFCSDILKIFFIILFIYGAPRRSRTLNLLIRSQPLYPIELEVLIVYNFNYIVLSLFNVIC